MLCVVTFSAFLPSFTSSSVVWANPSAAQKPTSVAYSQMFFMIGLPWLKFMTFKTSGVDHRIAPAYQRLNTQTGQFDKLRLRHNPFPLGSTAILGGLDDFQD